MRSAWFLYRIRNAKRGKIGKNPKWNLPLHTGKDTIWELIDDQLGDSADM